MGCMAGVMSSSGLVENLQLLPILEKFTEEELKEFSAHMVECKFKKGYHILNEGDYGEEFYIIIQGKCSVVKKNAGQVAVLEHGDYFGEQALLKKSVRNASVVCQNDVKCLLLRRKEFNKLLRKNPDCFKNDKRRSAVQATLNEEKHVCRESQVKSPTEKEWLQRCIRKIGLFDAVEIEQIQRMLAIMARREVAKGEVVLEQGVAAEYFYVVESGSFEKVKNGQPSGNYGRASCFGEMAILYDGPNEATFTATEESVVWCIHRVAHRNMLQNFFSQQDEQMTKVLKSMDIFKDMEEDALALICQAATNKVFQEGEDVVVCGEIGQEFYVILSGSAKWTTRNKETGPIIHPYFGELALMSTNEKRFATVTATSHLELLSLTKDDFTCFLSDKENMLKKKAQVYISPRTKEEVHRYNFIKTCRIDQFITIGVLGRGAFGYVTLVEDPFTTNTYALKTIRKKQILERHQEKLILREKKVMMRLRHKRLIALHGTFKDTSRIYFLLDPCLGGELFTLLRKSRYFKEKVARFYAACVIEAFEYMHSRQVIYRDLKPENLLLDINGYLKLTDFGFAKVVKDKTFTLCGTPDYIAPEILIGRGHGKAADWWTLGIFLYEMLSSISPFYESEPLVMYRRIVKGSYNIPKFLTDQVSRLITGLLQRKTSHRLGVALGGVEGIKGHEWFRDFDWKAMSQNQYRSPFIPKIKNKKDYRNFQQVKDKHGPLIDCTLSIEDKF